MAASKHEVIDSDDDGDDLSPLSSPLASPQLSPLPLPPIETTTTTETREVTTTTNLAHTSTSTDPSFFRDVYEEQQRAIGAQLAPFPPGFNDSYHDILAEGHAVNQSSHDPWEVPSSPIEVAGQQRGSYLKRKREEGGQASRQNAAVVVQLDDLSSGNALGQANTKKQKKMDTNNSGSGTAPALETISIPLDPLTPSRLHQYPRLLGSSINDDPIQRHGLDLSLDMSLEAARPLQQPPYEEMLPPNEDVTQSTIAFTTPSLYASSGRRAPGSSSNNNSSSNSISKQLKSSNSHDMDIVQEEEVDVVAHDATPPRRARKTADMAQIMSTPDIIAEPTSRESPRHHSPLPEEEDDPEEDEEGGVEWGMHSSHPQENTIEATRSQPRKRQSSIADELSISIDVPAMQSEIAEETYESDASYSSPKEMKKAAKSKKKSSKPQKKKAVFIAASDDEDEEDIIVSAAAPPAVADSESNFSDVPVKSKATSTKGKRGPKKKNTAAQEVLSVEILPESALSTTKAKRPRGRPNRQKTPPQEIVSDDNDEDTLVQDTVEDAIEIKIEPPEPKTDEYMATPDSEVDSEAELDPRTPVKAKGKKGKKAAAKEKKDAKAGRGRKAKADTVDTEASLEAVEEKTVLGNTSGNASVTSSFKADAENKQEVQKPAAVAKQERPAPVLEDSKPAMSTAAPERALLNTGLNTTASQGKVPYRVGLSKKFRIAPLLKMIRK